MEPNYPCELFCGQKMEKQFKIMQDFEYEKKEDLKCDVIESGIVHPLEISDTKQPENNEYGGVTNPEWATVLFSLTTRISPVNINCHFNLWYKGANPNFHKKTIIYSDEETIFLGPFHGHFGHFITESLSRLWFLLSEKSNLKVAYIGNHPKHFLKFLNLFGIHSS